MEILAGPILRHANSEQINIWLVLDSRAAAIDAEVLEASGNKLGASQVESQNSIQAGQAAFVYLLKVVPLSGHFPVDTLLYYDIVIDGLRLSDFNLTTGTERISYGNDALPSLILKDSHQVILEGSCRKPHATDTSGKKSQIDTMAEADRLLEVHRSNAATRPSLLFLTGDQIYADDVSAPVLAKIKALVKKYIGYDQRIPKNNNDTVLISSLELNGRAEVLPKDLGFTSGHKDNHLLSFGEYFMMYCAVWGGFDATTPSFESIKNELVQEGYESELDDLEEDYWNQQAIVNGFLNDAKRVRRLLANIPCYMILDDHEVTDDWNLDKGNYDAFRNHIFSRYVEVNALTAYWLCQGWGNQPDSFASEFKTYVQNYLQGYSKESFQDIESAFTLQYWGYEIDSHPYIVVFDTRTKREFQRGKLVRLMSRQTLNEVADRLKALPDDRKSGNSLLLIAASPVYGFTEHERKILAASSFAVFRQGLDIECWIANETAFNQLLKTLQESGFDSCSIFSGDVHYGFCRHEDLETGPAQTMPVFQLTSSSFHNASGGAEKMLLETLEVEAFLRKKSHYLIPDNSDKLFINSATNIGILKLNLGHPASFHLLDCNTTKLKDASQWLDIKKGCAWYYDFTKLHTFQKLSSKRQMPKKKSRKSITTG